MKRAAASLLVLVIWFAAAVAAESQQTAKIARIGFITGASREASYFDTFRGTLEKLGHVEGKNISFEYRSAQGRGPEHTAELARELVRQNVDVLVATPLPAIRAAKEATQTMPIVMITSADPVASGLIESLARPGANITGTTRLVRELSSKRLELLKEVVPSISRIGILQAEEAITVEADFKRYEAAARALSLQLQSVRLPTANPDISGMFGAAAKNRIDAIIAVSYGVLNRHAKRIADLAIQSRMPVMFERSVFTEWGGLVSYSANESESYRRAAVHVDKILKGTKPADIPVERPTEFEFVINLKTAKRLGLTIPQSVLYRADKVIQ